MVACGDFAIQTFMHWQADHVLSSAAEMRYGPCWHSGMLSVHPCSAEVSR